MKRIAFAAAAVCGAMAGSALAGEERACASQYGLEDHLLLEWAALGGDPHAQMAIAQCAFPVDANAGAMTPAEKSYAIRWTTIALCDALPNEAHNRRDSRLRKLKEDANISFRRFGGLKKNEKLNWRERDFMEYRKEQTALLAERHERLLKSVSPAELALARDALAEQLSRMGPTGLLKLAEMTSCEAFGASADFEAAAWSAASEAWRGTDVAGVYAAADSDDYDLPKIAMEKSKKLSGPDRRIASIEKERLLRTDPKRLAELEAKINQFEDRISIERLVSFKLPVSTPNGETVETPAVTLALQFALESLGFVRFVNGPDNDFGPTTREAVARMQATAGAEPTAALTNGEIRDTICKAAMSDDPVSLYHVAMMYQSGCGYPKNDAKAAGAITRAQTAMIAKLGAGDLPEWKREAYKAYAGKIRASAAELKRPEFAPDPEICK